MIYPFFYLFVNKIKNHYQKIEYPNLWKSYTKSHLDKIKCGVSPDTGKLMM